MVSRAAINEATKADAVAVTLREAAKICLEEANAHQGTIEPEADFAVASSA